MNKFKDNKKTEKIYKFTYRTDRERYNDATMLIIAYTPVEAVKKFNHKIPRNTMVDIKEFTELSFKTEESKEERG